KAAKSPGETERSVGGVPGSEAEILPVRRRRAWLEHGVVRGLREVVRQNAACGDAREKIGEVAVERLELLEASPPDHDTPILGRPAREPKEVVAKIGLPKREQPSRTGPEGIR